MAKIPFRESPIAETPVMITDFRGHSRTKTLLKSPRHSRGLIAVRVSPRMSLKVRK